VDRSEIDDKSNSLKSNDLKSTNFKSTEKNIVAPSTPITCWNGIDEEDLNTGLPIPEIKHQVFEVIFTFVKLKPAIDCHKHLNIQNFKHHRSNLIFS
jgi:hypothetical protein